MIITWYNKENNYRQATVTSMNDIECYTDESSYGIRIKEELVLTGGILGEFMMEANRDAAFNDIKESLESGAEVFDFRKNFYER